MRRLIAATLLAAALLAAPEPVTWSLQSIPAAPVKSGAKFSIKLRAKIQDGWHLYSMKPLPEGPIPTRVWLAEGQPFSLSGPIAATPPYPMHDRSFGMEVELYEHEAVFTLPLRVASSTPAGAHQLAVNASYQTCDSEVCLPPRTVKLELAITVAK